MGYDHFNYKHHGDVLVIQMSNPIPIAEFDLREELEQIVREEQVANVVVNLSGVTSTTSETINALIRLRETLMDAGGELRICGVSKELRQTLQVMHLIGTILTIDESQSDALQSFKRDK